jgi:hypothetical protein
MDAARLAQARADLVRVSLIAFDPPLYQVLALDAPALPAVPAPSPEISREQWRERFAQLRTPLGKAR